MKNPIGIRKFHPSGEIHSIELLRGIASAMVCFFHLSWGNQRFLPDGALTRKLGTWGWSGVEIFFVISGFIIPYSMYLKNYTLGDFWVFLKKRVIRIEPPYLISIVLIVLLNFLSTLSPIYRGAPFTIDWVNLLSHLAYLNVFTGGSWLNPVYWSLAVEFQYYLLIAFAFGLIVSGNLKIRLLFFVLFACSSFLHLPPNGFVFMYAGYFLAGILLFQFLCNKIERAEFWVLLLADILLLFFEQGMMLAVLVLLTLLIIVYVNKVPPVLRKLGMISYSLYLIHVPVGGRIINIAEVRIHNVLLRQCTVYVAFAICIAVSYLFYITVERIFKQYSSSIKYARNPLGTAS